jgi:hypothetical protein
MLGAFMRPFWRFSIIAALAIGSGEFALGATITAVDSKDGKTRLDLVGDITPGDAEALKLANSANRIVVTIRLNSKGGNLLESVNIADIVQKGKIATSVTSNSECASACFVIFAAGREHKTRTCTAEHRPRQRVIPCEQVLQPVRQAQHPLAHGHPRQHRVDQAGRRLGHALSRSFPRCVEPQKRTSAKSHVRFTPESGHVQCTSLCLL